MKKLLSEYGPRWSLLAQCSLLSLIFLIIDLSMPLGVAGGVPQVIVVLLALRSTNPAYPIGFAVLGSLMTLLGLILSDPLGIPWMVYTNRLLALIAIWVTALLGLRLKHFQSQLTASEGRFQLMADNAPVMIWRTDATGGWSFVSLGWLNFTGCTRESQEGVGWQQSVHEQDRAGVVATYQRAIERQAPFEAECRLITSSGKYRWVLLNGVPEALGDNQFRGFVGTALDIDRRVETEKRLEETRQKYFHREKMAIIGTLAGGMLHEIGNPTASIASLVQGALSDCDCQNDPKPNPMCRTLMQIQQQVDRITQTSQDIVDFTTLQGAKIDIHDLNQLVERTCKLISHDDRMRAIKLTHDLDSTLPAVEVIADNIVQLLFNLIENALEACQDQRDGLIHITTKSIDGGVSLMVADNGCGMSHEVLAMAEDPFFSTHKEKEGSGLGLALCRVIAEEYGGGLKIESIENEGTRVTVTLKCIY